MDYANYFKKGDSIADFQVFTANLRAAIGGLDHEVLIGIYVDADNRIIDVHQAATGNDHTVEPEPEKMVQRAKDLKAPKFVVAHNHPNENGIPIPSGFDLLIFGIPSHDVGATMQVAALARNAGVYLIDSLVVGRNHVSSIRSGLQAYRKGELT